MTTSFGNKVLPAQEQPQEGLRKMAASRALFWPGAGYALLGYPAAAWAGTALIALSLLSIVAFSFAFSVLIAGFIVVLLLALFSFWVVEYNALTRLSVLPGGEESPLGKHFSAFCVGGYACVVLTLVILIRNVGFMQFNGDGMAPTINKGEFVLYKKESASPDLRASQLVLFSTCDSAFGPERRLFFGRVLAAAGDQLSVAGKTYLLNGKPAGPVREWEWGRQAIKIPKAPATVTVPNDSFFIVQDNTAEGNDSRHMSWATKSGIQATRFLRFSLRGFGTQLETLEPPPR